MPATPIVLSWSGGKDSALALDELQRSAQYEVAALLTTVTAGYDRISMHGIRRDLLHQQAEALGLPLREVFIAPKAANVEYEAKMGEAFQSLHDEGIRHVAFGDIFLEDLKRYREQLLARFDLECVFPLWQRDTRELIETFITRGFRAVTCCVDPRVLDESFVGRELDESFLRGLPPGVDPCGENGEFHSFVFDGPNFAHPVPFTRGEAVRRDSFLFCDLLMETQTPHPIQPGPETLSSTLPFDF
jgi:uncharacterized protein (TIGR00290 family)